MEHSNEPTGIPGVLWRRILFTVLIGIGCLAVGISYGLFAEDRIILVLSGLVCLFSLLRGIGLWRTIAGGRYDVVEGVCVSIAATHLRKQSKVRVMDKDGVEATLCLGKQSGVKIGFCYRFYFKSGQRLALGSEYLDTALSTDQFLGFEELGKYTFPSEKKET